MLVDMLMPNELICDESYQLLTITIQILPMQMSAMMNYTYLQTAVCDTTL